MNVALICINFAAIASKVVASVYIARYDMKRHILMKNEEL